MRTFTIYLDPETPLTPLGAEAVSPSTAAPVSEPQATGARTSILSNPLLWIGGLAVLVFLFLRRK